MCSRVLDVVVVLVTFPDTVRNAAADVLVSDADDSFCCCGVDITLTQEEEEARTAPMGDDAVGLSHR